VQLRREVGLLTLLYLAYTAARLVADPDPATATANAQSLLGLEDDLLLDVEQPVNDLLTTLPGVALASSYWYSLLHYVVTPAVLLWVYRSHSHRYRIARNALVVGSALGIVGFALFPVAPPRMLPGYVDTLAATADHGWWGADASAPEGLGHLTNELAAMPSLHVGWAVWCAAMVLLCASGPWVRLLAVAYPVVTTVVVVATANHYLLDAVAGVLVIAAGAMIARARPEPSPMEGSSCWPSLLETVPPVSRDSAWRSCPTPTPPRTTSSCRCRPRGSPGGSSTGRRRGPTALGATGRRACPDTSCRASSSSWASEQRG